MPDFVAAVVGTGFIGPVHVEALLRLGVRVRGILGSSPAKSERVRQAFGLEKAFGGFEELLADDRVQVVHLAVPNVLHYRMAKQALLAGKHVMCEKPLGMTAAETAELVAVAEEAGRAAGVCYNVRFYPVNLEARARIRRGELGRIHSVVGSYVQDWLLFETDYNWRVTEERGGALRAVADIGTHWMDLVCSVTGLRVEAVCADLKTVYPVRYRPRGEVETFTGRLADSVEREAVSIDTDDCGGILLRLSDGASGMLWVSQMTAGRKNCIRYEISGAEQALAWNSESPNALWIGHRDRPNEVLTRDPTLMDDTVKPYANYPGGHNEGFPDTFKQCFRAFYEAIAGSASSSEVLYPTFVDGHREVVLCEAILHSHREGGWVSVSE